MDLGTFTLVVWFYVGGGRDEMTSTRGLSQADCTALAAEVGRITGANTWCRRGEPVCASCGLLPGRKRV